MKARVVLISAILLLQLTFSLFAFSKKLKLPSMQQLHALNKYIDTFTSKNYFGNHKKKDTLFYCHYFFREAPGFCELVHTLIAIQKNPQSFKGHLYELLVARHLHEDKKCKIFGINQLKQKPKDTITREFDLLARNEQAEKEFWIECKNCNWLYGKKYYKQFLEQQLIVMETNQELGKEIVEYEIYSNNQLPATMEKWFAEKKITTRKIN